MLFTFRTLIRPIIKRTAQLALVGAMTATVLGTAAEAQTLRERLQARIADRQASGGGGSTADAEQINFTLNGLSRSFLVHVPANVSSRPGVVMVLHGGRGTGAGIMNTVQMNTAADQGGFLAVYPEAAGEGARWTAGNGGTVGGPDDIAYIRAVISELEQRFGADPSRVFATGISSGGSMLYWFACEAPGLVRAIAPVSANMSIDQRSNCNPSRGTPIMMFSGTADPLMVFNGGRPELQIGQRGNENAGSDSLMSSPETLTYWAERNGCGGASETNLRDVSNDDTTVTQITHTCSGTPAYMFRINGGGHTWPGGPTGRQITGPTTQDISATATMVEFFRANGL